MGLFLGIGQDFSELRLGIVNRILTKASNT